MNQSIKAYVIKDLFGIRVIVTVNVINHVMLENNQIIKIFRVEKQLLEKLFEGFIKNIDENEMIYDGTLNDHKNLCRSCAIYIVLFSVFLTINIGIGAVFVYFYQ